MCIGLFLFCIIFTPDVLPHNGSRLKAATSLILAATLRATPCKLFKNALI